MRILRIIYVGQLDEERHQTASQRMLALADLGHDLIALNSKLPAGEPPIVSLFRRARRKLLRMVTHPAVDRQILDQVRASRPDILWIDKGDGVDPRTLQAVRRLQPGIKIIGYCRDDMMNPDNTTRFFVQGLRHYDVYFTTKSFLVQELQELGCPRVIFVNNSYHPDLHRPVELTSEELRRLGASVGFVGTAERERAASVAALGKAGIGVKIWGDHWRDYQHLMPPTVNLAGPARYGDEYAKVINAFDINLGFLRRCNRDVQTGRSVEIPACGRFMLAERTDEHRALFEEGVEAEFFDNDEELIEKTRWYLDHPKQRDEIARAGRQRCIEGRYSNQERLQAMLDIVEETRQALAA